MNQRWQTDSANPYVMIVDDDSDTCEVLALLLEDEGYRTAYFQTADAALDALREGPLPLVILLDLIMPGMDGLLFRKKQLTEPAIASVPVVLISGYRPVDGEMDGLDFAGYLLKPYHVPDLLACIGAIGSVERCPAAVQHAAHGRLHEIEPGCHVSNSHGLCSGSRIQCPVG